MTALLFLLFLFDNHNQSINNLFACVRKTMMKSTSNWSMALIESMKNPLNHVISSELAVVIIDKYPKSRCHYLVLPLENVSSIFQLTSSTQHLQLMDELELLAKNVIEVTGGDEKCFKIGYHALPSMQRLHLHVISNDFNSPSLKTKAHWNSFNTKFFLGVQDVHEEIRRNGKIVKLNSDTSKKLLTTGLMCHKCNFKPNNMPDLKKHLLTHIQC